MLIGLIGGIGPSATDFNYRRLITKFTARKTPVELTIAHADTLTLLANLGRDDKAMFRLLVALLGLQRSFR